MNKYLNDYLISRNHLIEFLLNGDKSADYALSDSTDYELNQICPNLNLQKGIKYHE